MKIMQLLLSIFILFACNNADKSKEAVIDRNSQAIQSQDSILVNKEAHSSHNIYSVRIGSDSIFLRQWDSTFNFEEKIRQA